MGSRGGVSKDAMTQGVINGGKSKLQLCGVGMRRAKIS